MKPAFLDRDGLPGYTTISARVLDTLITTGEFPRPRKLSAKRVGWLVREVDEWAESRPVSDNLPVSNCGRNQ